MVSLQAGLLLEERYQIVRKIGTGNNGWVYLAKDLHNEHKPVAVKTHVCRYEADVLKHLTTTAADHTLYFPRYHHYLESEHLLVMDYTEGETLYSYIQQKQLNALTLHSWIKDILTCFHELYATYRVYYDDFHTENMLYNASNQRLTLIDFGGASYAPNLNPYQLWQSLRHFLFEELEFDIKLCFFVSISQHLMDFKHTADLLPHDDTFFLNLSDQWQQVIIPPLEPR